jgi:hypothetical protein
MPRRHLEQTLSRVLRSSRAALFRSCCEAVTACSVTFRTSHGRQTRPASEHSLARGFFSIRRCNLVAEGLDTASRQYDFFARRS